METSLLLEEFSSDVGDVTVYYHVLRLEGSVYVWVGTDSGQMCGLVAAFQSRLGNVPSAASAVLGPAGDGLAHSLSLRLQRRLGQNVLLSVNLPDEGLTAHVEERLICHLSA